MSTEPEKRKRERPKPQRPAVESDDDLIGVQEVLNKTGWSLTTLDRRVADGDYPQPAEGSRGMGRKWFRKQHRRWAERIMAAKDKVA